MVVDDSDVVRLKLKKLLWANGFEVAGEAGDGASGLELVAELHPDLVIMDLNMPGMSGIDATWRLGGIAPETPVLVLTVSSEEEDVTDAIMAGAKGYVLKSSGDEAIIRAVASVAAGESVVSPVVAGLLVGRGKGPEDEVPWVPGAPPPGDLIEMPELAEGPPSVQQARAPEAVEAGRGSLGTVAIVLAAGVAFSALNQAGTIADGDATARTWLLVAFNFVLAFVLAGVAMRIPAHGRDPSR